MTEVKWLPWAMFLGIGMAFLTLRNAQNQQLNVPWHHCRSDRKSYIWERAFEHYDWWRMTYHPGATWATHNWFCYDYAYKSCPGGKILYVECERCGKAWIILEP